jgi:hypothetical protein
MTKSDIGKTLVEVAKRDFQAAQDALDGAKKADELANAEPDAAKKEQLNKLKDRFLRLSDSASTSTTTITSLGPSLHRSST